MARQNRPQPSTINVTERPPAPDLTFLPTAVTEYFAARGYHLTLASAHENEVAGLSTRERYPLMAAEMPEAERERLVRELVRNGCRQQADGSFRKGDCFIYIQSDQAREAVFAEGAFMWAQQYGNQAENDIETMNDMIRGVSEDLGHVKPRTVGPLSSHVARMDPTAAG